MIRYTMTVSDTEVDNNAQQVKPYYGLRAVNEQGQEVLSLPSISQDRREVEYLVNRFNQVKIDRSTFS